MIFTFFSVSQPSLMTWSALRWWIFSECSALYEVFNTLWRTFYRKSGRLSCWCLIIKSILVSRFVKTRRNTSTIGARLFSSCGVVAIFWARVLCHLAVEEASFRMKIILGVVLIRSLACIQCVPGGLQSGSGAAW